MDWRVKGVLQKTLSIVPGGTALNSHLQLRLGDLRNFEKNVDIKVGGDWLTLMGYLRRAHVPVADLEILEIGSGWHPALPLCFSLAGVRSCRTYDIVRHMSPELTFRMLDRLEAHLPKIADAARLNKHRVEWAYAELKLAKTLDDLLRRARVHYMAPGDAAATGLAEGSVDMVYSNSVLEHVHPQILPRLMTESMRILRPGGVAAHCVACNDHYAHFDRKISFVNFLRYGEGMWKLWNNDLNYQNRLRKSDFLSIVNEAGFEVVQLNTTVRKGVREALAGMKVAKPFQRYSMEDLETTSVDFIARKPDQPLVLSRLDAAVRGSR